MARDFSGVIGDYVELLNSPISAYPFTLAGRFKIDAFPNGFAPALTLYRHDTGNIDYGIGPHYLNWSMYARNTGFDLVSSSENTTGIWGHIVGVFASATDRRLYLNGSQIASDTSSVTFNVSVNKFALGAKIDNGPNASFEGQAAEIALWDVELTTNEISALANGSNPRTIQPSGLKIYWPLWGSSPEPDLSGNSNNGTVVGTTVVDHAPVGPYVVGRVNSNFIVSAISDSIVGAVTVVASVAATTAFTQNFDVVGDVTVGTSVAATTAFTQNFDVVGSVTLGTAVAAVMDFNKNFDIVGNVTVGTSVVATLSFNSGYFVVGTATVGTAVAAVMDFTKNLDIVGAVAVAAVPSANLSFSQHPSVSGDVAVSALPAATLVLTIHPAFVGDVAVSALPAATMDFTGVHSILGVATVSVAVVAATNYTMFEPTIVGSTTVVVSVNATLLAFARNVSLLGSATVTVSVSANLNFGLAPDLGRLITRATEDRTVTRATQKRTIIHGRNNLRVG